MPSLAKPLVNVAEETVHRRPIECVADVIRCSRQLRTLCLIRFNASLLTAGRKPVNRRRCLFDAALGRVMSYGLTVNVLQEVLPLDHVLAASSIRRQVTALGRRLEAEQATEETAPKRGPTKRQGGGLLLGKWTDTIVQRKTGADY